MLVDDLAQPHVKNTGVRQDKISSATDASVYSLHSVAHWLHISCAVHELYYVVLA